MVGPFELEGEQSGGMHSTVATRIVVAEYVIFVQAGLDVRSVVCDGDGGVDGISIQDPVRIRGLRIRVISTESHDIRSSLRSICVVFHYRLPQLFAQTGGEVSSQYQQTSLLHTTRVKVLQLLHPAVYSKRLPDHLYCTWGCH